MRGRILRQRFVRLDEQHRRTIAFHIDGEPAQGMSGDTVLIALLNNVGYLRHSEFGDGTRAGFCLMGACQDCWVATEGGEGLRACTTPLSEGLRIKTGKRGSEWLKTAS